MEFTEGLRKVFLACVGAVASTAENAKELIDDLVEKGELTVAQGRMLNEELKHTAKEKVKEHISVTVTRNYTDAMNSVDQMTEEELNALKEKIAQTEEARKEQLKNTTQILDEILSEGTISDINLRMLVKRIFIHQNEDKSLDIRFEMNGEFNGTVSVFIEPTEELESAQKLKRNPQYRLRICSLHI